MLGLLSEYTAFDGKPDDFWGLTFREYDAFMEGQRKKLERNRQDRLEMAWHIEALHRMKRMPKIEKFLERPRKLTSEEVLARMDLAAGGKKKSWNEWVSEAQ